MHGARQAGSQVGALEGAVARAGEGGAEGMGPRSHRLLSLPRVPSEPGWPGPSPELVWPSRLNIFAVMFYGTSISKGKMHCPLLPADKATAALRI